jgi:nitroreductase
MDALTLLRTRHSASKLDEPAPPPEAVRAMLDAAARAPDHGQLQPWRLILIEGEARHAFGEALARGLSRRNPLVGDQALSREREKALRAPLIIVVATQCDRSAKIPVVEQIISAGCVAHSLMLAASAQGLGAMWRTGDAARDETIKRLFDIEADDLIVGFIYVGTETGGASPRARPVVPAPAHHWTGGRSKTS